MEATPEMINILKDILEVSRASYILDLIIVGCGTATGVCILLYKFIKSFF